MPHSRSRWLNPDHGQHLGQDRSAGGYTPAFSHQEIDTLLRQFIEGQSSEEAVANSPSLVEFSLAGAVLVTTACPRYYKRTGIDTSELQVHASLNTAGTAITEVTIYKNGTSIGTVALASGETAVEKVFNTPFNKGDYLRVLVTTAGASARDLAVSVLHE